MNEESLLQFEDAWQRGDSPRIEAFLSGQHDRITTNEPRLRLLAELICLDLEFRWRNHQVEQPLPIEDYLAQFPELNSHDEILIELAAEEYRARHRWGDAPAHEAYNARFMTQWEHLRCELEQVDNDLSAEADVAPTPLLRPAASSPQIDQQQTPLQFSDYLLQRQIGAGAIGKVYVAFQRSLERTVAVKFLRKSFCSQPWAVQRFINEARTVARLNHRGIVGIHGLGQTSGGGCFIVMDHVEQGDMQQRAEAGDVTPRQAAEWVAEACDAIQHAHDHNVVHCDLKPGNVLLDADSHIRVTDFGFARSFESDPNANFELAGTAPYMAPEQITDFRGPISERTDVYGLGGLLFALLTGHPPYSGNRISEILTNIVAARSGPEPTQLNTAIPADLNKICRRCLSPDPAQRYASPAELGAELRATIVMR